jgi:hypothetical protein
LLARTQIETSFSNATLPSYLRPEHRYHTLSKSLFWLATRPK